MFTTAKVTLPSSSKKNFFERIFKNAQSELVSDVEESSRRKVRKSQIKLLYVDETRRLASDAAEWKRCERRVVSKDQITLVGVDCTKRLAADAGVELVEISDPEVSDDDDAVSVASEDTLVDVQVEYEKEEEFLAEAEVSYCTISSAYSTESMCSFADSICSTDSDFSSEAWFARRPELNIDVGHLIRARWAEGNVQAF